MLKNFLTIAFRNLRRQKFYAFINIVGLAVGIGCCLLIILFVQDELRYDVFHENADRIYRLGADLKIGSMESRMTYMPAPLGPTLKRDFPEVEVAARLRDDGSALVRKGDQDNIKEEGVFFADPELFQVFTLPLIKGDPQTLLKEPQTLVLTTTLAKKYFGEQDPLGQVLTLNNRQEYQVVGVMEALPSNSHFHPNILLSMEGLDESKEAIWLSHNFYTYILLQEGASPDELVAKFPAMLEKYAGPQVQMFMGINIDEFEKKGDHIGYFLQSLTSIHLHSDVDGELEANGDITFVYIFSAIAIFILLIACINFMNLSTARSASRALEVGVRKVLGSLRRELIFQFLMESVLLSVIAFAVALWLASLLIPYFNELSGKALALPLSDPLFIGVILAASIGVGILAGIYPALFLSSFRPIMVLKGRLFSSTKGSWVRSGLVVFQFFASIVLIVCTLVVNRQLNFLQDKKLGYNKEQVLVLQDTYTLGQQVYTLKQELLKSPYVSKVTVTSFLPVPPSNRNTTAYWPEGQQTQDKTQILGSWSVDHDYLSTMDMEIVLGRDFSLDLPTDSQGIILNETAVKRWGFEQPIGQRVTTFAGDPDAEGNIPTQTYTVIGVVKDFHFESLRENISGLGMFIGESKGQVSLRINTEDVAPVLEMVEARWKEFAPGQSFNYSFLDDRFDKMYQGEQRLGKIFASFAFFAIFVACLGLFALAAFMAEQRTREIGIRKVMGATVPNILVLLSKDFTRLVLVALVLAIPVSWYAMHRWLEGFFFHYNIGVSVFIIAGALALLIALITVSYQSLKAAHINPVKALKQE